MVLSVGGQVYAGEISGHCGDVGIVQALCDRAHQLAGIVFSRAVLEGLERAREELRRLSGQLMRSVAERLDDADIAAVTGYFASVDLSTH